MMSPIPSIPSIPSMARKFMTALAIVSLKTRSVDASFNHQSPVVRIKTQQGGGTAFKVIPNGAITLGDLNKENAWFTAGHLCLGQATLQLSDRGQTLEAHVKELNPIDDWCYLSTECTKGPGYSISTDPSSNATTASLSTLSGINSLSWSLPGSLPWTDTVSQPSGFGFVNFTGIPGDLLC
jgi:hypothetical protein